MVDVLLKLDLRICTGEEEDVQRKEDVVERPQSGIFFEVLRKTSYYIIPQGGIVSNVVSAFPLKVRAEAVRGGKCPHLIG
jgi:hypothetical protein